MQDVEKQVMSVKLMEAKLGSNSIEVMSEIIRALTLTIGNEQKERQRVCSKQTYKKNLDNII